MNLRATGLTLLTTIVLWAGASSAAEQTAARPVTAFDEAPERLALEPLAEGAKHEARAEIVVLHGTNSGKGIDPRLGDLKQLEKPPFSAYDSYELLTESTLALSGDVPAALELPNKGNLRVQLKDVTTDKKGKRYVVDASISKPGGKKFLPVLQVNARPGEIFFVAGQKYKKGVLVLGIRIHPPKAK